MRPRPTVEAALMGHRRDGGAGVVCRFTALDEADAQKDLERWRACYPDCWIETTPIPAPVTEPVTLHDGPELQHLVPGVDPVSHAVRQMAQELQRRASRRGYASPPMGGLFDDVARAQQELF